MHRAAETVAEETIIRTNTERLGGSRNIIDINIRLIGILSAARCVLDAAAARNHQNTDDSSSVNIDSDLPARQFHLV